MGPALDTLSDGLIIGRCRCLNAKHTSKKKVQFVKHTFEISEARRAARRARRTGSWAWWNRERGTGHRRCWLDDLIQGSQDMDMTEYSALIPHCLYCMRATLCPRCVLVEQGIRQWYTTQSYTENRPVSQHLSSREIYSWTHLCASVHVRGCFEVSILQISGGGGV